MILSHGDGLLLYYQVKRYAIWLLPQKIFCHGDRGGLRFDVASRITFDSLLFTVQFIIEVQEVDIQKCKKPTKIE